MKKPFLIFLSILFFVGTYAQDSLITHIVPAAKTDLHVNMKPGSSYQYKSTFQQNVEQQFMDKPLHIEQAIITDIELFVEQVQDHETLIKATFKRIQINSDRSLNPYNYDSEAPNPNNPLTTLDNLIGHSFWLSLDRQGAITQVKGWEEISNPLTNIGSFTDFGQPLITFLLGASFHIFNDSPVAVGENWINSCTLLLPGIGKMTTNPQYTLEGLSEDLAWLHVQSAVQGPQDIQGQINGTYEINRFTGLVSYGDTQYHARWNAGSEENFTPVKVDIQHTVEITP